MKCSVRALASIVMIASTATSGVFAQTAPNTAPNPAPAKKALAISDYTRWRSIDGAQLSDDGKWLSYGFRFMNTPQADAKPVLHIKNVASNQEVEIANATSAQFSDDSKWGVYTVDVPQSGGRGGRGNGQGGAGNGGAGAQPDSTRGRGAANATPPRRIELRELATGRVQFWQDMQSATFSPTGSHLLLRRRGGSGAPAGGGRGGAPGGGGGGGGRGGGGGGDGAVVGSDVILHDLASGRSQFLGSVGEASFNRKGDLLAYTVEATPRDGNGLYVIDLKAGRTAVIDNDPRIYSRLTWNDEGTSIAVLKGKEVDKMRERDNSLVVFSDIRASMNGQPENAPVKLDVSALPKGWVISERGALSFSDDSKRVFFGIIGQSPAPDTSRRRNADSTADVDIWRTQDERIQSQQMIQANADRNFTFRSALQIPTGKYTPLSDSTMRTIEISGDGRWAVGRDTRGYISDYERPRADFYRVNTSTGERTLMFKGQLTGNHVFGLAPDGNTFLYWKDNKFQSYTMATGATITLAPLAKESFIDTTFDHPGPKPAFGIEGYTADGKSVIVDSRYDMWELPLDGSAARNITNGVGAKEQIAFHYVRTVPFDPMEGRAAARRGIDLTKPVTLSAYGEWTKKAGFYELANGELKPIIYEDASFSTPLRAQKGDNYLFTRQTFAEFPDLRISSAKLTDSKKVTDANPQQSEFLWGHRILFDYKTKSGNKLQGILAIPDDYQPGEKRPMIVTFYEKNSQNMHRYSPPSFITGMGNMPMEAVTHGYLTMLADVYFHTGRSHSDMLEAVEAATKKVIEMGYADPKKIGVHGHSYGGEGAAFIGTMSRMFAAVGMGAGVTDLYTDFNQSWGWTYQVQGGSGANGNDYYMYGQGRWGFSPWEKPDVYHYESALTHVPEVTAPFLMMHGTADPTVSFTEGMNFYNAMRFNKKDAILLAYPGEGHGLGGLGNRMDLTQRYFQFFDHYLKGAPAPKWMTDGVPFLVKDQPPRIAQ